jgi:hypothetical protein
MSLSLSYFYIRVRPEHAQTLRFPWIGSIAR